ncbi:MAG: hypothetical protein R2822_00025 [Spirosomataceae bacterium]
MSRCNSIAIEKTDGYKGKKPTLWLRHDFLARLAVRSPIQCNIPNPTKIPTAM